jgi:hypothetical protein
MEDGHGVGTYSPIEGDSRSTQQQRIGRICAGKRLVSRHLCAYELGLVINEGDECAVAIHLVHAMLDESIEGYVAAGDWIGGRPFWDLERKRCGREISRAIC